MEMSLACPLCLWMGSHVVKVYITGVLGVIRCETLQITSALSSGGYIRNMRHYLVSVVL